MGNGYNFLTVLLTEQRVKYAALCFAWTEFLWETYLLYRQYNKIHSITTLPPAIDQLMPRDQFDKSRAYTMEKIHFGMVVGFLGVIVASCVITFDILSITWNYSKTIIHAILVQETETAVSLCWVALLFTAETLINMPLALYQTFYIEQKYGYNKQTLHTFFIMTVIFFIIAQVINTMISYIIICTIRRGGDNIFWYLWMSICSLTLGILLLYPTIISPMFNSYKPLPNGDLKSQVDNFVTSLGFPKENVFVLECDENVTHGNAYFFGVYATKRIVLYDTLLKEINGIKYSNEEILAILAHELGHWKHNHVVKYLAFAQVGLFFSILIFTTLFTSPIIYKAFGFASETPILVGFVLVTEYLMVPYNSLSNFASTTMSRRYELQADHFAVKLGKGAALKSALCKLNKSNIGFPIYDSLYSAYYLSHPSLLERLEAIH